MACVINRPIIIKTVGSMTELSNLSDSARKADGITKVIVSSITQERGSKCVSVDYV